MADIFDTIGDWILTQAIEDAELNETLSEVGERLLAAGIPICRISLGRGMSHPVIGLASLTWTPKQRHVDIEVTPPTQLDLEEVRATPFGHMVLTEEKRISARLTDPVEVRRFPMFEKMRDQGITHYLGFSRNFSPPGTPLLTSHADFKGAAFSFCTERLAGFSPREVEGLERLIAPLCVSVRVAIDRILVSELLNRYLGAISGSRVLTGQTARGDGTEIECVLFCSDMCNSAEYSRTMEMNDYLGLLNTYFDCAAGAVLDHGGEVLKLIGDGVLAIFPFDNEKRPPQSMCLAALSAAREAYARLERTRQERAANGEPPLSFGVALAIGKVIYGNVGTERRLDFTATGPAVALVSRCEALTRTLDADIIATAEFANLCDEAAVPLGHHEIRGFDEPVSLLAYDRS